ncbi:MAG: UvrD-helicase domain-containing protein [Paraglaciecola chathamensis]
MDAIESARKKAEQLHLEVASVGGDICDPLSFVLIEIARRDIEVSKVTIDDPQLKGGKAVYDSQAETIIYSKSDSKFEEAFLIAHELAHIVLEGGEEDFVSESVDFERSSEEPAIGVERVLDYGSHERREVTMDIFAREFLLPRSVLRDWYLKEKLNSISISKRTCVPVTVIQQQLIDALLLPPHQTSEDSEAKKLVKPDASQKIAASHRGSPFQLQAGPGTGKTSTLVHRIVGLLDEGVDPSSILVLTFSNKAAGELRERVASMRPDSVAMLWIGTFHAFGLDIVHRFHQLLSYSENPLVIGKFDAVELLESEIAKLQLKHYRNFYDPTLDLNDILNAISRAKDEVTDSSQYQDLAEKMLANAQDEPAHEQAEKCLEVAAVYKLYERLLKERDTVDFGDLVRLPVTLIESNKEVRESLAARHQHVLVDEYQDVNRASVRLLKSIVGQGERLWVVGDSRQSIYRFRGASSINMRRFSSDFPEATAKQLDVNYRSHKEIINLFTIFSNDMKASEGAIPLNLEAQKASCGAIPELRIANNQEDEISAIAAGIVEHHDQGFDYEQQAVLCTSNSRLAAIATELEKRGIPVLHLGSLFERDEIRDLLSLLSLLTDKKALGLIRAANFSNMNCPLEDLKIISRAIRKADSPPMGWLGLSEKMSDLSDAGHEALLEISRVLEGFKKTDTPWTVLATLIIDRLRLAERIAISDNLKDKMQGIAIWQLLNFCHQKIHGKGLFIDRLLLRIRRIVQLSEDGSLRQLPNSANALKGVRIMTIHASKGLEFKVVHMPGLVTNGLPASNRSPRCLPPDSMIEGTNGMTGKEAIKLGHDEEEECKFFVGVSRAKDRLMLYAYSKMADGKNRSKSKYVSRIQSSLNQNDKPPLKLLQTNTSQQVVMDIASDLEVTDSQLSSFDRCPRRFFYSHVLELGGKRVESPFVQMHSVVYDVLDWLKANVAESSPSISDVSEQFDKSWLIKGPIDHGYSDTYREIGFRFVEFLLETRQGKTLLKPEPLKVTFPDGNIVIQPDEVFIDDSGIHKVRRIRSGKLSSKEHERIEYSVLLEAAELHYGKGSQVESVHLTCETQKTMKLSAKQRQGRLDKSANVLKSVSEGNYPISPSSRNCPTCPNFFICGDVPKGKVIIKS